MVVNVNPGTQPSWTGKGKKKGTRRETDTESASPPPTVQGKESAATSEGVEVWVVRHGGRVDEVPGVRWDKSGKTNPHPACLTPRLRGASVCVRLSACPFLHVIRGFPPFCSHHVSTVMCTIGAEMLQPLPDRSSPSVQPAA